MLGHSRDYHRVIEYASRALSLEPGIQDAYYWISIAAEATGNSMMKDRYDQMARDDIDYNSNELSAGETFLKEYTGA